MPATQARKEETLLLPLVAHMGLVNGKPAIIEAEYYEVSIEKLAQFFLREYRIQHEGTPIEAPVRTQQSSRLYGTDSAGRLVEETLFADA